MQKPIEQNIKHEPPDQLNSTDTPHTNHKHELKFQLEKQLITTDNNHRMRQLMKMNKSDLIDLNKQYNLKITGMKTKAQLSVNIIGHEKTKNKPITNFFKRKRHDMDDNNVDTPDPKRRPL